MRVSAAATARRGARAAARRPGPRRDPARRRRHARADRPPRRRRPRARADARAADRDRQALRPRRAASAAAGRRSRGGSSRSARSPTSATTAASCCAAGATEPELDPELAAWTRAGPGVRRARDDRRARSGCACAARTRTRSRPSTGAARPTRRPPRRPCAEIAARGRGGRASRRTGGARCSRSARRWRSTRAAASRGCCADAGVDDGAVRRRRHAPTSTPSAALRELRRAGRAAVRRCASASLRRDARRAGARGRPDRRRHAGRARSCSRRCSPDRPCASSTSSRHRAAQRRRGHGARASSRVLARRRELDDDGSSSIAPAGGSSPPLIGLALGRRAAADAADRAPARRAPRPRTMLPEHRPGRVLLNRLWPLLVCTVIAGGAGLPRAADPGDRGRLRDHLGARLAPPGRGGGGDRGARRRALLRRAHLAGAPDGARAHARASRRAPDAERRRHLRRASRATDVLLVSLGSTGGLRAADDALRGALERAGARWRSPRPPSPQRDAARRSR